MLRSHDFTINHDKKRLLNSKNLEATVKKVYIVIVFQTGVNLCHMCAMSCAWMLCEAVAIFTEFTR